MRNLKRVLSLVLALMMTFSLMVFTTSASAAESATIPVASTMYGDYDDIEYKEAIDVMTAIGIVDGTGEGADKKLNPTEALTRAQATKILAGLLLTPEQAANFDGVSATTQFDDVLSTHWAASYIAYCTNQGIVSGHSPTEFDPDGDLTGIAFGKMLLVALGYDAVKEGYVGNNWTTNVAVGLINAGIIVTDAEGNNVDLSAPLTREVAMEMAFQALQAPLVEYTGSSISLNGQTISIGNSNATYVLNTLAREQRINNRSLTNTNVNATGGYTVEFAEKYFPSLWLFGSQTSSQGSSVYRTDEFGRPAHTWTYKNVDIKTYEDTDLFVTEWVGGVDGVTISGETIAKAINYSAISNYNLEVYVDGLSVDAGDISDQLKKNSKDALYLNNKNNALTGNGVLTQVFVDHEPIYANNVGTGAGGTGGLDPSGTGRLTGNISIVIIHTYLAEVTNSSNVKVYYSMNESANDKNVATVNLKAPVSEYSVGDKVLVTMYAPDHTETNKDKYNVYDVNKPEVVNDVAISSYTLGEWTAADTVVTRLSTVTADGTKYEASYEAYYDANVLYNYNEDREELTYSTFALYKDAYGFILGVEEIKAADNYIFVVGWDKRANYLGNSGDWALIITTDGQLKAVPASAANLRVWDFSDGKWVSYLDDGELRKGSDNKDIPGNNINFTDTDGEPAVNTWYTYSMSGDTYVLEKQVLNQGKAVATNNNTVDPANGADISGVYASLKVNGHSLQRNYAYGNDYSKYFVTTVSNKPNSDGSIVELDRTITGIKNASIKVESLSGYEAFKAKWRNNVPDQYFDTFFIYDDGGFVTYAVTVGEVTSASTVKVFFTSNGTERGTDADGTKWVEYKVIVNNEEKTVRVLDNVSSLNTPTRGEVWDAKFDANGYIISLDKSGIANGTLNSEQDKTVTYNEKYALLNDSGSDGHGLTLEYREGRTLWITCDSARPNGDDQGYIVLNNNCKVFLSTADNSTPNYKEYSTIEEALKDLSDTRKSDKVWGIAAICDDNGYATTLVITYTKPANYSLGSTSGSNSPSVSPSQPPKLEVSSTDWNNGYDTSANVIDITIEVTGGIPITNEDVIEAIIEAIGNKHREWSFDASNCRIDGAYFIVAFKDEYGISRYTRFTLSEVENPVKITNVTDGSKLSEALAENDEVHLGADATLSGGVSANKNIVINAANKLTLSNGTVNGMISGEGDVEISGAITGGGNITTSGQITIGENGTFDVLGQGVDDPGVPTREADVVLNGSTISGNSSVYGTTTVSGTVTVTGTLTTNRLVIESGSTLDLDSSWTVVTVQEITLKKGAIIQKGDVLYVATCDLEIAMSAANEEGVEDPVGYVKGTLNGSEVYTTFTEGSWKKMVQNGAADGLFDIQDA